MLQCLDRLRTPLPTGEKVSNEGAMPVGYLPNTKVDQ